MRVPGSCRASGLSVFGIAFFPPFRRITVNILCSVLDRCAGTSGTEGETPWKYEVTPATLCNPRQALDIMCYRGAFRFGNPGKEVVLCC